MSALSFRCRLLLAALLSSCVPLPACAHIKWFANVDVAGDPLMPWQVMGSNTFALLAGLAIAVLATAAWLDAHLTQVAARRPAFARWHALDLGATAAGAVRLGIAACFMANVFYFRAVPVLLTPELKTHSAWALVLPWTVALAAVFERPRIAAAGIALLFGAAIVEFGSFHLLDYPLFIGIAIVLWHADAGAAA